MIYYVFWRSLSFFKNICKNFRNRSKQLICYLMTFSRMPLSLWIQPPYPLMSGDLQHHFWISKHNLLLPLMTLNQKFHHLSSYLCNKITC